MEIGVTYTTPGGAFGNPRGGYGADSIRTGEDMIDNCAVGFLLKERTNVCGGAGICRLDYPAAVAVVYKCRLRRRVPYIYSRIKMVAVPIFSVKKVEKFLGGCGSFELNFKERSFFCKLKVC